jgi:uncharacterized protein YjiK
VKLAFLVLAGWMTVGNQTGLMADSLPTLIPMQSRLIAEPSIGFDEPSGLAYDRTRKVFWTVSDDTKAIFLMQFNLNSVTRSLPMEYDELEGVTIGFDGNTLFLVREKGNLILQYNLTSRSLDRAMRLSDMEGYDTIDHMFDSDEGNKGLEGITVDVDTRRVFVVKEAKPRLLIQLSSDLTRIEKHWKLTKKRGFDVAGVSDKKLDISGLAFDSSRQAIWMASDRGGCIFLFDLKTAYGHKIPIRSESNSKVPDLSGIEGMAVNDTHDAIFAVSDDGNNSRRFDFVLR